MSVSQSLDTLFKNFTRATEAKPLTYIFSTYFYTVHTRRNKAGDEWEKAHKLFKIHFQCLAFNWFGKNSFIICNQWQTATPTKTIKIKWSSRQKSIFSLPNFSLNEKKTTTTKTFSRKTFSQFNQMRFNGTRTHKPKNSYNHRQQQQWQ